MAPRDYDIRVVDDVPRAFAELVAEESPGSIALSGGDTARACYGLLADAGVEWGVVSVLFGDERWVPVDDPDSNEGMARKAFLDEVAVAAVHSLRHADPDHHAEPENAAGAYDALLRAGPPIGVVHLGVGPDGHTASLFPGDSAALGEGTRLVVVTGDGAHPHRRLTMTLPAIARARLVVFTVAGAGKAAVLARLVRGDDLPAARVRAERVVWLVDDAAASSLAAAGLG